MKILVVNCHPRRDSLPGAMADTLDENALFDLMLARVRELGRQFDA
ncbi:MAG: NAD(P)H-dependent oxidoreductase [Gammaproteobacteria bacterium]|nr:NAD(P)H-dependent oxidoreductase [Gammaproteobacteria bacterium]MCP4392282.1 NAD(P)H-dependent oxidoreductase [Gammaproteobacteria bacterium]MCP4876991.1 NAD(P)H-dependent oxidoreductase [Gammaproteobacteria bacterium]